MGDSRKKLTQMLGGRQTSLFSCRLILNQTRSLKRWQYDPSQIVVTNFHPENQEQHQLFQQRRLRYARKNQLPPIANDYDTEEDHFGNDDAETEEILKPVIEQYNRDVEEVYAEIRRDQIQAKDDPSSPHYFSDEEKAIEAATTKAHQVASNRMPARHLNQFSGEATIPPNQRYKQTKILPEDYHSSKYVSTLIPDSDPIENAHWDHFPVRAPDAELHGFSSSKEARSPLVAPNHREPKINVEGQARGIGKRKTATARVLIAPGSGKVTCNGKPLVDYFPTIRGRESVMMPLMISETMFEFDVDVQVRGGGVKGQAEAVRHGIARALENYDPNHRLVLKLSGLLKRDPRVVERKKPGKPKARKSFTWVKR